MEKKLLALPTNILISSYAFFRSMLASPNSTGMICPSSKYLCEALAEHIPQDIIKLTQQQTLNSGTEEKQAYIVEFGAGTGNVTRALLEKNIPPSRLLVFEYSKSFADYLKKSFPGIRVIQDDAANLPQYLPHNAYAACIVSSIPFVSLPKNVSLNIIGTMKNVIEDRLIIQYTYALTKKTILEENGFVIQKRHIIWKNVPPACIHLYRQAQN